MRRLLLVLLPVLAAGCAAFGYQPATVSRPRDQVWKELGDFKAVVGYVEGYGTAICEAGKVDPSLCTKGKTFLDAVKAKITLDEQAALAKGDTVDWSKLATTVLPLLNQYLGTLGIAGLKLAPGLL